MKAAEIVEQMGWEQTTALHELSKSPDIEGATLCKLADCSFDELFSMGTMGLIDIGMGRLETQRVHPVLTDLGREVLELCASKGIV